MLTVLLKLIHGSFIYPKDREGRSKLTLEEEVEAPCDERLCFIHKTCFLNLKVNIECKCGFKKDIQSYYHNNFTHVVNGTEYLSSLEQENTAEGTPKFKFMWEVFKPQGMDVSACDNPHCAYRKSVVKTSIKQPLPQVLILNFNWANPELSFSELLKVFLSFQDSLQLSDLYNLADTDTHKEHQNMSFSIDSFICFVGAHYLIFVSEKEDGGVYSCRWKLINDTKTQLFNDWGEVVDYCLSSRCVPTLVFFERFKGPSNQQQNSDQRFSVSFDQQQLLQMRAMEQDEYLNPFMNDAQLLEEQQRLLEQFAKQKSAPEEESKKVEGSGTVVQDQVQQQVEELKESEEQRDKVMRAEDKVI